MKFQEYFNIWEAKQRLDPKCWKGYRKKGTKMKGGKRVNNCVKEDVITEGYKLSSSFTDLPDSPPHGFWIAKDGKFIVIPNIYGHDNALQQLFPDAMHGTPNESSRAMAAMKLGLMRVGKAGRFYEITYHPLYMTGTAAKKTAKDIAEFYNMGLIDRFEDEEVKENFADGKNPEHKGDSKRYGVPTKSSVSKLRKVAKQGGRKGQLAHWMANMKAGKAKKK